MDQSTRSQTIHNLEPQMAQALLREASIGRQQQSGNLTQDKIESIRLGKQDQSIGFDDAVYALTNADSVWDQAQAQVGQQQS